MENTKDNQETAQETETEPYNNRTWKDWIRLLFWISLVVGLGMLAINQSFEFYYRAEFLKSPCKLCLELNPEVSKKCFIKEEKLFPNGLGGWQTEEGVKVVTGTPSINISEMKINN